MKKDDRANLYSSKGFVIELVILIVVVINSLFIGHTQTMSWQHVKGERENGLGGIYIYTSFRLGCSKDKDDTLAQQTTHSGLLMFHHITALVENLNFALAAI